MEREAALMRNSAKATPWHFGPPPLPCRLRYPFIAPSPLSAHADASKPSAGVSPDDAGANSEEENRGVGSASGARGNRQVTKPARRAGAGHGGSVFDG
ncbi:hypothetical protein OPV22_023514 [Ensete ventricosum]|uniref:AT-hook motif nuclear-localized protein n=1 Tax=Ensete ventricosum TaxID=4639 RepID=A0AAV8QLZ7_ENSVE|nr:hypothetical protein OPV22_023514 [Ensete ventricosum]